MDKQITIAIHCHNFQKRLCWMLSSIVEQTKKDLVKFDIGFFKDNGSPKTIEVIDFFRNMGLEIHAREFTDYETFKSRGKVRNYQLRECTTEWILFSDCDMVFSNVFFEVLEKKIDPSFKNLYSSARSSTDVDSGNQIVDSINHYPCFIENSFEKLTKVNQDSQKPRNCGAGFFQLMNYKSCKHDNVYLKEARRNPDEHGMKWIFKSDIWFRQQISKNNPGTSMYKLEVWFRQNQMHLNHLRDSSSGYHREEQR